MWSSLIATSLRLKLSRKINKKRTSERGLLVTETSALACTVWAGDRLFRLHWTSQLPFRSFDRWLHELITSQGNDSIPAIVWHYLVRYSAASMGDTPILLSTQIFVSSVMNKAMCKGLAGIKGILIFEEAHFRHLNQPDLYIVTVERALDLGCKCRRPRTKRSNDWSCNSDVSCQILERRTSETKTRSHVKTI